MKSARLILSALILIVPIAFLALQARPQAMPVEEEVKAFEQQANAAYEANDLAKYFSFYARDFSQFLPEGRTDLSQYQKDWTAYVEEGNRVQKVELPTYIFRWDRVRIRRWPAISCMCGQS